MKVFKSLPENPQELCIRPHLDYDSLFELVGQIFKDVQTCGDEALVQFIEKFDNIDIKKEDICQEVLEKGDLKKDSGCSEELKAAIDASIANIEKFHRSQKTEILEVETTPGVSCWRKSIAIDKVGLYIPGGTAPLFSTLIMLAVPAKIAGCKEIVVMTPPFSSDQLVHPAIRYICSKLGIEKVYISGGAGAIAALAQGTQSIPKVDKIYGPGNQYVMAAKAICYKYGVGIDMLAGPSEVLVIADDGASPKLVASDLLSQAEHGVDSQVVLVTTSEQILNEVLEEVNQQVQQLERADIARECLKNSEAILVSSIKEAIEFSNLYAPEHLILSVRNAKEVSNSVINAGSVFVGPYSAEAYGDYCSGTNHSLPTNGWARVTGGVSLDSFVKKVTFQELSQEGAAALRNTTSVMARAEGLQAHARAAEFRAKLSS